MLFSLNNIINFQLSKNFRVSYIDRYMKDLNFDFIREGRTRRTYLASHKRYVLKFPINHDGLIANQEEGDLYKTYRNNPGKDGVIYAPCRLIQDSILMMQSIDYDFGFQTGEYLAASMNIELPSWSKKVDCHQVGMNSKGKIVAYDFAR